MSITGAAPGGEQRSLRVVAAEPAPSAADPWDERLDALRAREVLAGLGAHHRAALTLRYLDGLSVPEVAVHLQRTLHATEALLVRGPGGVPPGLVGTTSADRDQPGTNHRPGTTDQPASDRQPTGGRARTRERADRPARAALRPGPRWRPGPSSPRPLRRRLTRALDRTDTDPTGGTVPSHRPPELHTVTPYPGVSDSRAAIRFYVEAFGAEQVGEPIVMPDGSVGHAQVRIGDAMIFMADGPNPEYHHHTPTSLSGSTAGFVVYVPDVDAAYARAVELGATPDRPPRPGPVSTAPGRAG